MPSILSKFPCAGIRKEKTEPIQKNFEESAKTKGYNHKTLINMHTADEECEIPNEMGSYPVQPEKIGKFHIAPGTEEIRKIPETPGSSKINKTALEKLSRKKNKGYEGVTNPSCFSDAIINNGREVRNMPGYTKVPRQPCGSNSPNSKEKNLLQTLLMFISPSTPKIKKQVYH